MTHAVDVLKPQDGEWHAKTRRFVTKLAFLEFKQRLDIGTEAVEPCGKLLVPALKKVLREVDIENGRIVFDAEVLEEVGCFAD